MKNNLFFTVIFIFFVLAPNALGNSINIKPSNGLIHTEGWEEVDIIEGLDLKVTISLGKIIIDKSITQSKDNFSLTLDPGEFIGGVKSKKENVTFKVINRRTNKNVIFNQEYDGYSIKINPNNFDWDGFEDYPPSININYTIKNYIDDRKKFLIPLDPDKTVVFGTGCLPEIACPKPKNIHKTIVLPKNIILRSYTEKGSTLGTDGSRIYIYWNYFTSEEKGDNQNRIIQYTDLDEVEKKEEVVLGIGILLGAITGGIISLLIQCYYHKKSKKEIENEFNNLNEKLNEKFQSLNKRIDKLAKSKTKKNIKK